MRTLHIFGDSFSTNFSMTNEVSIEESWPYMLSKELNFNLKNHASPGISNYGILNSIYENSIFGNEDIVIIGFTFYDRLYDFWKNIGIDLRNDKTSQFNKIEIDFYKHKILDINGMMQYSQNSLLQYKFIIESIIKSETKILFWNMDKTNLPVFKELIKKYSKNYIKPYTESCWIDYCNLNKNWWQTNNDKHFGKVGHKEFFEYLYQYIQSI